MRREWKKEVVDSLRERRDSVSSRFDEYELREPESLSDEEAASINRQLEDGHNRMYADD
jgi:hypothetical protein